MSKAVRAGLLGLLGLLLTWANGGEAERPNLLRNPAMAEREAGKVAQWSFHGDDAKLFRSEAEGGQPVVRYSTPGRYSSANQSLRLKPNAIYRLEARVRGTAGIYLRARTHPRPGGPSVPHTAHADPSAAFRQVGVPFRTGPDGKTLVIIGNTQEGGKGEVTIVGLRVVEEPVAKAFGPPIPVTPGEVTVVEKLLVADCRALRGFLGAPVDGSVRTRDWGGGVWEYNDRGAGGGVGYAYRRNDGLHITLADAEGFHAVQFRGGARAKLYRDGTRYDDPASGRLIAEMPRRFDRSCVWFDEPVRTARVGFFDVAEGRIADVSFLRVSRGASGLPKPMTTRFYYQGPPTAKGFPHPDLIEQFGEGPHVVFGVVGDIVKEEPFRPKKGEVFHLFPMFRRDQPIGAVGLDLDVAEAPGAVPFTAMVMDPLNRRSRLMEAHLLLSKPGRCRVVLRRAGCARPDRL